MTDTVSALIAHHPSDALPLGAPDRPWLTYGGLRGLSAEVTATLNGVGIGRGDRVAIVLPNGPEMAAAFVTVAQAEVTAPLNPAYREDEFEFYLSDLKAKAIIVEAGSDGPALRVARRLGLVVLRLEAEPGGGAGRFALSSEVAGSPAAPGAPEAGDVALILHTSGTTSRPKIVPLLQSNVAASARNIMASLELTSGDRCLNVMPLFHIHGLVAAVSASRPTAPRWPPRSRRSHAPCTASRSLRPNSRTRTGSPPRYTGS